MWVRGSLKKSKFSVFALVPRRDVSQKDNIMYDTHTTTQINKPCSLKNDAIPKNIESFWKPRLISIKQIDKFALSR